MKLKRRLKRRTQNTQNNSPAGHQAQKGQSDMNFKVWTSARGAIFATLEEASRYAAAYQRNTGVFVAITRTNAKATHTYKVQ